MSSLLKTFACVLVCSSLCQAAFNTTGCGVTKMCVRNTDNCNVSQADCLIFSFSWDPEQNNFLMEMSGGSGEGTQYHGVGFSPSGNMADADVYFCTGTELRSGVIQTQRTPPVVNATLPAGVTSANASTEEGVALCTFRRTASLTKTISGNVAADFNLLTTNYFVIQARSSWTSGPQAHTNTNRWRSTSAVSFNFPAVSTEPPAIEATTMPSVESTTADPTADCGMNNKRCYRKPSDCNPGASGCTFVSWVYSSDSMSFQFELIGGTGVNNQYAAVAFAPAARMENADLYYCSATAVTSGVIRERYQPPTVLDSANDVRDATAGTYNGMLRCSFTRSKSVTKEISNQENRTFDLIDEDFFILYAVGQISNGSLTQHADTARAASESTIDFSGASHAASNLSLMIVQMITFGAVWLKNL